MIPEYSDCALLVIDMQDKLLGVIPDHVRDALVDNVGILIDLIKNQHA